MLLRYEEKYSMYELHTSIKILKPRLNVRYFFIFLSFFNKPGNRESGNEIQARSQLFEERKNPAQ